jgi:ribonucleoside-diphosphate reductase alpha chain
LPVFDCAFKAHRGQRSIAAVAHLRMMAAVQPFISGAISKTVNMPKDASVADIRDAYVQAWRLGLKCVAMYRDSSKRSQPLNTKKTGEDSANGAAAVDPDVLQKQIQELEAQVASLRLQVGKPLRRRLPDTRVAVNHKFNIAGHEGYLNVGLFEDRTPGEVFITMSKEGSTIGGLMDSVATLTSISLQYGVPLEALVKKFSHQRFEPSGMTKNPEIRTASSITDYIFRWLAFQFIPGYREANSPHVGQQELPMPGLQEEIRKRINKPVPELPVDEDDTSILVGDGAAKPANGNGNGGGRQPRSLNDSLAHLQPDAPICPNCGHITVRNGFCYKCLNCGESLGCS